MPYVGLIRKLLALLLLRCAAVPALEVSRGDQLQGVDVERLIGDDALQAAILVLERTHFRDVADFHAAELRLPFVKRGTADSKLAADIAGLRAGVGLLNGSDDLRFGEP